jgi:transposase
LEFVCAAHKAGLPIVVCNHSNVRNFVKSTEQLAKADQLDAVEIAHFREAKKSMLSPIKPVNLILETYCWI